MAKRDYYQILGVGRGASDKEIRNAYRKLARKHHPDLNPSDKAAEARFKEASEAYEVLSDPEKRKLYDRFGAEWQKAAAAEKAGVNVGGDFGGFHTSGRGSTVDFGTDFDANGLGDIFDQLFGGGSRARASRPRRGQDIEYRASITLEEAYAGTLRTLQVRRPDGSSQSLEVKVPAGVKDGSRVRVAGKGGPGVAGGPAGDLYLVTSIVPHSLFRREGDDLHTGVEVPLHTAVLGGEVFVPTPKGTRLALKLPAETQNGQSFRLSGQGMPRLGGSGRGDLYAEIKVVLPAKLSQRERELFGELAALRGG